MDQIYAPEKVLVLHDLDKKKLCLHGVPQPNFFETEVLPPGVGVCSVRCIWSVTKARRRRWQRGMSEYT